jgi:hypothetical protein
MTQPNYQTVKLARGRHVSPDAGVCVMELASLLSGETFTDRPRTVSPVIAGFLRAYNDLVDDRRRQDLFGCAAEVVGTRECSEVELARATRLRTWGDELRARRWWRRLLPQSLAGRRRPETPKPDRTGAYAVHSIFRLTDEVHASVLSLVNELVDMGSVPAGRMAVTGGGSRRSDAVSPA